MYTLFEQLWEKPHTRRTFSRGHWQVEHSDETPWTTLRAASATFAA